MAKKKPGTARTTISVPMTLKRRMEKVGEPINWSAIAAAAFEQKLAEIAEKKERKTMNDVIERLRGSKRKSDAVEHKEGEAVGREWAMHNAAAVQLERLAEFFDGLHGYEEDAVFLSEGRAYSGAECIFFVIEPDCEKDRDASRCFWQNSLGGDDSERIYRTEFLRGFVQGSLEVWNHVRDQI